MNTTIDTTDIIKQIEQIQAMVYCARQTVAAEKTHEGDMAANLLLQADNQIFNLKRSIDPALAE